MKKILALSLILLLLPLPSFALDCVGKVTKVMDWPAQCPNGVAYRLNVSNGKWICSKSKQSDSIILTAVATDKLVTTRVTSSESTCDVLATHYIEHEYIIVEK